MYAVLTVTVRRYIFYCMIAISFGTLSAWIVKSFAPYAQGAGIPEIKVPPRSPPLQRLLLKLPSLSLGCGLRDFVLVPTDAVQIPTGSTAAALACSVLIVHGTAVRAAGHPRRLHYEALPRHMGSHC